MAEIFQIVVLTIASLFSLAAFFAVLQALFPDRLVRTQELAASTPGRSTLIGLVNFIFFSALGLAFTALADRVGNEILRLPTLLILAGLVIGLSFGLAAIAALLAERLVPQSAGWKRSAWGATLLGLACALPFAGWFALLPYTSLLGLGAFIASFFRQPAEAPLTEEG